MRFRLPFKFKLMVILAFSALLITSGVFIGNKFKPTVKQYKSVPLSPEDNKSALKFQLQESIVNGMSKKMEFIPLEVDLTEKIIIDESWGQLAVFKKLQNIEYFGKGIYAIDLSTITKDSVIVDTNNNAITIYISKPFVKTCSLQEEKTLFQSTEKGLLRFGEITLTSQEQMTINKEVNERMMERMKDKELNSKAMESSKIMIRDFVLSLSEALIPQPYEVIIEFKL